MLYIFNINVNFLSIDKLLNVDVIVAFHKIDYILAIDNNLILIDTRNRNFFFLNL